MTTSISNLADLFKNAKLDCSEYPVKHSNMARAQLAVAGLLIAVFGCQPGQVPRVDVHANMVFVDVGDVPPNSEVEKNVQIFNTNPFDLVMEGISASCGCVERKLSRTTIPSGERADLHVRFLAPAVRGRFSHHVEIQFLNAESTHCAIEGSVGAWFSVSSSTIDFGAGCQGDELTTDITVTLLENLDPDLGESQLTMPYARILNATTSGNQIRFILAFHPTFDAEATTYKGDLLVGWQRDDRTIRVPCTAIVSSPLLADPPRIFLGVVSAGEVRTAVVKLKAIKGEGLDPSIQVSPTLRDCVLASWQPELSQIAVAFDSSRAVSGEISGSLMIDNSGIQTLIPIQAFVE